jgi:L-2-hydroxyglutarate oxidase LhgO
MADTGVTVIGAGVVGLAVAKHLAPRHPDLVILERHDRPGQETSSRNSEVIHAGMYYPAGSLKAVLCVEGNRRIYEACERHDVPHRRLGKLIVARTAEEIPAVERLFRQGRDNGATLEMIGEAECRRREPNVTAVAALWSPNTGIVSAHGLMDHYLHAAKAAGATLQPRTEVVGLERDPAGFRVTIRTGSDVDTFTSERVVNAAGLDADTVAALAGVDVDAAGYRQHWWKGSYFAVAASKAGLVTSLVYPVPGHVSLGTHAVVGLEGRLRFGPDAEYLPDRRPSYAVDEGKRHEFGESIRRLVPAIGDDDIAPDISGIRAKLQGPGQGVRDFVIEEESARGLPGLVNLLGIDSPGLTSSAAIADRVARLVGD